ncbi:MAG TPA: O-antigen ligase family protein [Bacilli bacterium]|nr:O-antigen ligase family protein [Bacilli bacterium]
MRFDTIELKDKFRVWALFALAFFPLVDYLLRQLPLIGFVGSIWDKALFLGLLVLALGRFFAGVQIEQLSFHKWLKAFIALGVAYLVMHISTFAVDFEGFRAIYWYSFYAFILPFVVDEKLAPRLVHASVLAGFVIAIHGVYQYILPVPIPPNWTDAAEHVRTRVFSVFGSPNIMGAYMNLIFATAAGMSWGAFRNKHGKLGWFFLLIALTALASLLFTNTRGAWLALFGALVVTSVLFDRRMLIAIVVVGVVAMFVPQIQSRFEQLFSTLYWTKALKDGRLYRWMTTYDVIRHNPLFGFGMGHFGGAVAARNYGTMYVDNYYAKTMAELGLIGLSMMLTLFVTIMKNLYTRFFKSIRTRQDGPLLLGMYTGLLAVLIQNAVENVFEVPAMNFLFWFFVSLIVIMTRPRKEEKAA